MSYFWETECMHLFPCLKFSWGHAFLRQRLSEAEENTRSSWSLPPIDRRGGDSQLLPSCFSHESSQCEKQAGALLYVVHCLFSFAPSFPHPNPLQLS